MSVRRDTPRGPTSEQLRRSVLAHAAIVAKREPLPDYPPTTLGIARCNYCGRLSPHGCTNGPCAYHS